MYSLIEFISESNYPSLPMTHPQQAFQPNRSALHQSGSMQQFEGNQPFPPTFGQQATANCKYQPDDLKSSLFFYICKYLMSKNGIVKFHINSKSIISENEIKKSGIDLYLKVFWRRMKHEMLHLSMLFYIHIYWIKIIEYL